MEFSVGVSFRGRTPLLEVPQTLLRDKDYE